MVSPEGDPTTSDVSVAFFISGKCPSVTVEGVTIPAFAGLSVNVSVSRLSDGYS